MSNKNKYGGTYGGTKKRRKKYEARNGKTEFTAQSNKKPQKLTAKTESQKQYIEIIHENDIVFADGPAGCGKTFVATALGLQGLLNGDYERLVITRPVLEAGENLGFLPGNANEKIRPYIEPIFDTLRHFVSVTDVQTLINSRKIEIAPLAYMRGRTFDNSFIIVDEAQNCTMKQLKMAITRIGSASKIVVNGDVTQSDWDDAQENALEEHMKKFKKAKHPKIAVYSFNPKEIVRNAIIGEYLEIIEGGKSGNTN